MPIKYKVLKINRTSIIIPTGCKFELSYDIGDIVKCIKGSIGIMVFKSAYYALDFANACSRTSNIVIKVKPIGRMMKTPIKIVEFHIYESVSADKMISEYNALIPSIKYYSAENKRIALARHNIRFNKVPDGTECYPAVEVLE